MGFYSTVSSRRTIEGQPTRWETHVNDEYNAFLDVAIGVHGPFHGDRRVRRGARALPGESGVRVRVLHDGRGCPRLAHGPRAHGAGVLHRSPNGWSPKAKEPVFSAGSWAPLAELVAVGDFVRVGAVQGGDDWTDYAESLMNWATSSKWDCWFIRMTGLRRSVFLELEERSA